ncbi:MAG: trigger factor [Minisyncoccota bacterium]
MNVTVKKLPASQVEIHINVPWEEWQQEIEHAVEHLARGIKIPGFRAGKVPHDVVEKRLGKPMILAEVAEHIVQHSYPKALAQEKIEAIGKPVVELGTVTEHEPFSYQVVTAVLPVVTLKPWKPAVQKINAEYAKQDATIDEQEIMTELERLAEMRAKLVTVNREARLGDNVIVDFVVLQNDVPIENGTSKQHPLVLGKGAFIPGFEEQLFGMQAEEEKTFTLTFPATYHVEHLAGKPATFQVKVTLVQKREVPLIDDVFASGLGKFESLEKLKETMRNGLLEEKKLKLKEAHRSHLLDTLVEHASVEHPHILIEEETKRMVHEFEMRIKSMGLDMTQYLEQAKKTPDEMRAEWQPQAEKRLSANMILDLLAREEEMDVESVSIEAEMNKTLMQYKDVKEAEKKINMERLYGAVREHLLNEKVLTWLETL